MDPFLRTRWRRSWYRALFAAWWLRFVPYVRLVGLNGSMVTGTFTEASDIDFYIVVKRGHIFTARVLTTALVHILGIRRHGSYVAGRVCQNRYAADDFLEITPHNQYHARVFHNMIPLAGDAYFARAFVRANRWMAGYQQAPVARQPFWRPGLARLVQVGLEFVLTPFAASLEERCRRFQRQRAAQDPRVATPGSVVVLSDNELRFHLVKSSHA